MARVRINWQLIIVLILAIAAVVVTGISLRKYHRQQRAEVGLEEGLTAYTEGRWKDAAVNLGRYLSIHQDDVDILIKYAQSQIQIQPFKREHLDQAVNAYRVVLRHEDNEQAAREIIDLYMQFGMPAEAELIAQRFADLTDDVSFRLSLAAALNGQRKYEQSQAILNAIVHEEPGQIQAYQMLGQIADRRPELAVIDARQWYDKAIAENPDSARAYIMRSDFLAKHDQIAAAIEDLQKAEKCDLSEITTRLNLAAAWIQQREFDRALTHLETIKAQSPDNEQLWYLYAQLAGEKGDREQMVVIAEKGLESLGRTNYTFLSLAAELFVQAGQLERAGQCVTELNEAEAEPGTILYLEGLIARASMDWTTAIEKWQRAIQLGFSSEMIYLNLADTLDQINNRPMAIQLLRRYLGQAQASYEAHLKLASLFAQDQYWQQALEQATAAVQLNPANIESRILYLRSQIELADTSQPFEVSVLKKAIENLIDVRDTMASRILMFHLAMRADDYVWAQEILQQVRQKYGENEQILISQARLLLVQDKIAECIELLKPYVHQYPDTTEIIKLLAWGYSHDQRYDACQQLLETAMKESQDPLNQRKYQLWLAEAMLLEGRRDDAISLYREMAEQNKSDIYVRRQLLELQYDQIEPTQLQQWIDEIKMAEGDNGWQWKFEQARLWARNDEHFTRKYEQMVKLLNENLSLNPDDQASRILLASIHERAGNVQLALSLYHDAMVQQSNNLDLIIAAVGTMYRAEEYRQAQELLNRVSESGLWDPRLARYELQNSLRIGEEENAIHVLEKMVNQSPEDYDAKLSLALVQMRNGNLEEAEVNIRRVLTVRPDSIAATAAMAELYVKQKKHQEALQLCDSFILKQDTLQAHTMRCQVLLNIGDIDGVAQGLTLIHEKFGADKEAMLVVSRLYQSIGQPGKSGDILQQLLDLYPDDFAVQKQAALLFANQLDAERRSIGQHLLQQALEQNPEDVALRLQQAALLIQENNTVAFQDASVILKKLVKELPRLEEAWRALGELALIERKPAEAMDYALRGLYYLPDSRPLLQLKAQAESARSPISAISTLKLLLQDDPSDKNVVLMLSQNYRQTDQYDQALELLDKSLSQESLRGGEDLQREKMIVLYMMGKMQEAKTLYQGLISSSSDGRILLSWLELLSRDNKLAEIQSAYQEWAAIHLEHVENIVGSVVGILVEVDQSEMQKVTESIIDSVLKSHPQSAEATYAMAIFLHLTNQKDKAVKWYERTIQLNPQHVIAMNNLAWILCTEQSQYRKALEIAERGLELRSSYVDLIDTRGVIFMNLDEYEKAAQDFRQCEKMYFDVNPSKTAAVYRLAKCLLKLEKKQEALVELYKAKDMNAVNGGLSSEELADLEQMIQKVTTRTL